MKIKFKNLRAYLFNIIIIWFAILFYNLLSYYKHFLRVEAQSFLFYCAVFYTVIGFFYYLLKKDYKESTKGEDIFNLVLNLITFNFSKITKKQKTSFLFVIVKVFFLPLMINFVIGNYYYLKSNLHIFTSFSSLLTINSFNSVLFPILLGLIFFIDTLWFAFGYLAEAGFLKNKIRSVEPTFLGWFVALICYPPFNSMAVNGVNLFGFSLKGINWFANDYTFFYTHNITFIFRIIIIILLGIYVSATLALGTRCSNLTNRGIVKKGPYKFVRHPAYISKNTMWWLTIIPVMSLYAFISMFIWSFIYHLRTITEEKHLSKDIDYKIYKQEVKYRYIPGIY